MIEAITLVENNVAMGWENIILLIMSVGSIIFMAKDFRLGFVLLFFMSAGLFAWFFVRGYEWVNSLIVMLMSLIIMSLTLYFNAQQQQVGGFI